MKDERTYNLDKPSHRTALMTIVNGLSGLQRVTFKPAYRGRTLRQNSYYWGCALPTIRDGMEETWGERLIVDEVHEFLRAKFLDKPVVNRETGEVVGRRAGSTAALNVNEFVQYLDQCIKFAGEYLNTEIPEASHSFASSDDANTPNSNNPDRGMDHAIVTTD